MRSVRVLQVVMAAGLCLVAVPVRSEALVIDSEYSGHAWLREVAGLGRTGYNAEGSSPNAKTGLTSLSLYAEGWMDFYGGTRRFEVNEPATFGLRGQDGDALGGYIMASSGPAEDLTMTFRINRGLGPFEGFAGDGTVTVRASKPLPLGDHSRAPATITVRGTVSRPSAIPEPTSIGLLSGAVLPIALLRRRCFLA